VCHAGSWLSVLPDFSPSGTPRRAGIRADQTAFRANFAFSAKIPADSRQLLHDGCIFVKKPAKTGVHFVALHVFSYT